MSAFVGTPSPLSADVLNGSPPKPSSSCMWRARAHNPRFRTQVPPLDWSPAAAAAAAAFRRSRRRRRRRCGCRCSCDCDLRRVAAAAVAAAAAGKAPPSPRYITYLDSWTRVTRLFARHVFTKTSANWTSWCGEEIHKFHSHA